MEFYQTVQEKRFFEHTLPQIVKSLGKIAESLSAPASSIRIAQEVPKDFLTELFWGNYDPSGKPDSEASAQCCAEISEAQEVIKAQVSPDVWAQVENIFALISRRNDIDRAEAYATGFRAAATMLAAGLSKPDSKGAA